MADLLGAGLAAAFSLLALLIPDPIMVPWRLGYCLLLIGAATATSLVYLLAGRRWAAALLAASGMVAMWQGARPWIARQDVVAHTGRDAIDVERHFVVGYSDMASIRDLIRKGHVGGVFVTRRNVAGRSTAAIAAEVAGLQALRRAAGLPPLVVAADQEGGPVSHLSPPLPAPPSLSTLAGLPLDDRRRQARALGAQVGSALGSIGITMDLAPVSDLMPSGPSGAFDWNTQIATRAISADPAAVADIAAGFSEGLIAAGLTPTAKHFPGLGRVAVDTHLFGASLDAAERDLGSADWVPFKAVLGVPGTAVMLAHVALGSVDRGVPASRSKRIVSGILRGQWGFDGIAITDDLGMGAVEHAGLCQAVEGALNAGIDLLLVSWDTDKAYPALQCALSALDAGRLDRAMLQQSDRRLDRLQDAYRPE